MDVTFWVQVGKEAVFRAASLLAIALLIGGFFTLLFLSELLASKHERYAEVRRLVRVEAGAVRDFIVSFTGWRWRQPKRDKLPDSWSLKDHSQHAKTWRDR